MPCPPPLPSVYPRSLTCLRVLALLLFLLPLRLQGQAFSASLATDPAPRGTLRGTVRDKEDLPAEGLAITLENTTRASVTNGDGQFAFDRLPVGDYTLVVSGVHVLAVRQPVRIVAGEVTTVDLRIAESVRELEELTVRGTRGVRGVERLPDVENAVIYAGKKTEVITLADVDANLVTNNARQVFAKTPGIQVWENDGSGVQVGVASRGLSPNRSWEFNVRQNGYDVSSDPFGYPEAYYNPPMEAVEKIQVVRGASSLQFGPQFGGLLNYVLKRGDATRPIAFESQQTAGSYGLFSSFNAVGGTRGKLTYYGYYHHRQATGWRQNSRYDVNHAHASLSYALTSRLRLGAEYTNMQYNGQQAGGLTDAQLATDARQSSRGRNWLGTPWQVLTFTADYALGLQTQLSVKAVGLWGERNSVGFVPGGGIVVPDTISRLTRAYAPRQLDRDTYRNWGAEARLTTGYQLGKQRHTLAAGLRYFQGNTRRQQQGRGDTGTDFNTNLQTPDYPRDLSFTTVNYAAFAENIFRLTRRWSVVPGARLELIRSNGQGRLNLLPSGAPNNVADQSQSRAFVLLGLGTQYQLTTTTTLYANVSQAYRPVQFADLTPPATTDVIDPNLRDASGYNADLGVRGSVKNYLSFDVGGFYLRYDNRIGTLTQARADGSRYQFRTNLGTTVSQGVEGYAEFDPVAAWVGKSRVGHVSVFASVAFINAQYVDFRTAVFNATTGQLAEGNLAGNRVENAPRTIHRFGATYALRGLSVTWQLSSVGDAFADAGNTTTANATATAGIIPAYRVMDVSATYRFLQRYNLRAGINNLADARYFTRRSGGYPGPGLLPSDGRTAYVSFGIKL